MWQDPIVAEIHTTRERLSQAYGNDLHAIFTAAQRGELAKPLRTTENKAGQDLLTVEHPVSAARLSALRKA